MAEEPDNLTLVYLRGLDQKMDRVLEDVQDLEVRMTHVGEGLAGVSRRLDRMDTRLDKVERRLEPVDGPYGGVRE